MHLFERHQRYTEQEILEKLGNDFHVTYLDVIGFRAIGQSFLVANHLRERKHFYSFILDSRAGGIYKYRCIFKRMPVYLI